MGLQKLTISGAGGTRTHDSRSLEGNGSFQLSYNPRRIMQCLQCEALTENPKFCNRSCSATYNNKRSPKRKPEHKCLDCGSPCTARRARCADCYEAWIAARSAERWLSVTLGEFKANGNANFGSRYPYLRSLARKSFVCSGRPMVCEFCGYSTHVEIAHFPEINSWPNSATIAEINHLDNLHAFCRNHHWEFDNGLIALSS